METFELEINIASPIRKEMCSDLISKIRTVEILKLQKQCRENAISDLLKAIIKSEATKN